MKKESKFCLTKFYIYFLTGAKFLMKKNVASCLQ